jgi:uncharacterized protein (UPF0147 family)
MAYENKEAILDEVYQRMADGESLSAICRDENMPTRSTVNLWIIEDGNSDKYARAKEIRADLYFEQIIELADDRTVPADDRRIAIDARKWAAGKLHGKYSDKVKHVGGDDGDNPIAFTGFDVQFV